MGEETEEELKTKEPLFKYIIRQLFNQKVILGFITLLTLWITIRQQINSGKQDKIIAKADTVAANQIKVDSTTIIQSVKQVKRDSTNLIVLANQDTIKQEQRLLINYFKIKTK